jgi:dihydrofolate reductase
MGRVRTGLAVSLDGFISGPNDGAGAPMGDGSERLSAQTSEFLRETREATGALVFGRRTFDLTMGGVASIPWMYRSLL